MNKFRDPGWKAKAIAIIMFLVGIILVIIGIYIDYMNNTAASNILLLGITVVGSSLLTAAIGTLTIKHTGILDYIGEKAEKVLVSDEYINNLSLEKLKRMKQNINAKLYSPQIAADKDSLLNYTLETTESLLTKYYYERYDTEVNINLCEEDPGILEKTIIKEVYIKPMLAKEECDIGLSDILRGSIGSEKINGRPSIEIVELKIGDISKKAKISFDKGENKHSSYCKKYEMQFAETGENTVKIPKEGCNIFVEFITRVDIDDRLSFSKIPIPCKNFSMRVRYDEGTFSVKSGYYGFINEQNIKTTNDPHKDLKIKSNSWILPGACIMLKLDIKGKH